MNRFPAAAHPASTRLLCLLACLLASATGRAATPHTFTTAHGQFLLDGHPFQIISGEMHYARIPREDWRIRLRMARAMGLNTITTYVFWNEHEPQPGVYDFSGQRDVAAFIRIAQSEGLYVLLRPGPYSCAEWDWGGYPAWLLKDHAPNQPAIVVRSRDPRFLAPARQWLLRLGHELAPLQLANGGPILAVQVENEYGSFGDDHAYMQQIRQDLSDAGFDKSLLYTADGPEQIPKGSLPDLPAAINFGPGEARHAFDVLHRLRPNGPFMAGEYWDGWFDHWGQAHQTTDAQKEADEISWMLHQGYSLSLYMFHGGTSFGWMNGANSNGATYEPDVTSYDYDSPLDESGRVTPKYALFRKVIAAATGITPPPIPSMPAPAAFGAVRFDQSTSLWQSLPAPVHSPTPLSMEDLDQAYGYILYRTTINEPVQGDLLLDQLHDYAQIYANGALIGTLDRRLGQNHLPVHFTVPRTRLDLLVENTGRINFGPALRGERQGITRQVLLAGQPLAPWTIFSLPMLNPAQRAYHSAPCAGPCFYRGTLHIAQPADTFLDTRHFSKGFLWINGRPLGRIWHIGPQQTLFLPGAWLHKGDNQIVVFDLSGPPAPTLNSIANPILNELHPTP
jgi:beta-galactosidase